MSASLTEHITRAKWVDVMKRLHESVEDAGALCTVTLFATRTKAYPLHALCKYSDFPYPILLALTKAFPAAVRHPVSPSNALPIHIACSNNASLQVIQHLVSLFPESTAHPDSDGNLPIHHACSLGDASIVEYLASVSPESVQHTNLKKHTPLHMACNRYNISLDMVRILMEHHPGAITHRDWQRQLPLHKAVAWKATDDVILALLNSFPDAARMRDKRSLTPYKIGRQLGGLNSNDPIIKLLRAHRCKHGQLALRTCDVVQFRVETMRDKILPSKRARTMLST